VTLGEDQMPIEYTVSADGTTIGYHQSGSGPPVVLVHGTSGAKSDWGLTTPQLELHLTVLAMDRRGRGRSPDVHPYAIEREFEDVVAVVEAQNEPAHVVGVSWGAICALGAARRSDKIRSLVLYEPPIGFLEHPGLPSLVERTEELRDTDDVDGILQAFYDFLGESDALAFLRGFPPAWNQMTRDALTIPRELRAGAAARLEDLELTAVGQPTVILVGELSAEEFHEGATRLADLLPNATVQKVPGQTHAAQALAPEEFGRLVRTAIDQAAA
jgi:pimeloyl-ACP methyl ester carboxylesterase